MSLTIIHRYHILAETAVRAVLDVGDCRDLQISFDGVMLVIDVIGPVEVAQDPTHVAKTRERKGGALARQPDPLHGAKRA